MNTHEHLLVEVESAEYDGIDVDKGAAFMPHLT
jgi:hypothetical protein